MCNQTFTCVGARGGLLDVASGKAARCRIDSLAAAASAIAARRAARTRVSRMPRAGPCLLAGDGTLRCMSDESTALPTVLDGTAVHGVTPARGWEPDHVEQLGKGCPSGCRATPGASRRSPTSRPR